MDSNEKVDYDYIDHAMDSERESSEGESEKSEDDEYPFEVLTTEEIVQDMSDIIKEVSTVLEIPATTTRILLNHFKWDKDKLLERFYDGDQEKLFAEARIINPFRKGPETSSSSSLENSMATCSLTDKTEECEICFLTLSTDVMNGLDCGHRFCTPCWREYFQTKIMEEGEVQMISCPAHDCDILVDYETVMHFVEDPKVKLMYQHLIKNSFVACNRLLRWCRTPDCNRAIKVQYVEPKPVTCNKCKDTFCFQCGEDWHDPIHCEHLRKWIKLLDKTNNDERKTTHWMLANTKECINCRARLQKTGGCDYAICPNKNCRAIFCWGCLQPWNSPMLKNHKNRLCKEFVGNNRNTLQEKSKAALTRYQLYFEKYMNHKQSLSVKNKLYEKIKVKMEKMQLQNMSSKEVQFLQTAVDILRSCRRTLMYSYAFAYSVKENNQSEIFCHNQSELERETETLSEYLKEEFTYEDVRDIKQKIENMHRYCESRRKVLSEHVKEGYEKGWWEFID